MKFSKLAPTFIRRWLRPVYYQWITSDLYQQVHRGDGDKASTSSHQEAGDEPPKQGNYPREVVQGYWKSPDAFNTPERYLAGEAKSRFLVTLIGKHAPRDAHLLELGCNVGRNLHYLYQAGYRHLTGIELNPDAIALLTQSYPEMAQGIELLNTTIEEGVKSFKDGQFNLVFTMAVLQHVHYDSDWVLPEIARITRDILITIEDEGRSLGRHFPRNYKNIFEAQGLRQIKAINCAGVVGLGHTYTARVYRVRD